MKYCLTVFIWLSLFQVAAAQNLQVASDSLFLNIIIPEEDTVIYNYSRYRVAANTHPQAAAFINGEEAEVYASGAFVGMIRHQNDTTRIEFTVAMNGDSIRKEMVLIKPYADDQSYLKGKTITNRMVRPVDDLWLDTGETLNVQFLGTPGQKVVFNIDDFKRNIPMKEAPPEQVNGRKGVYRGSYKVKPDDFVSKKHITFKMKKNIFSYNKRKSDFTVSFNGLPRVGVVKSDEAYLNIGMGTDRLGGAKYGFLENGVMLNITGQKNENYRVQLTNSLDAWIPVSFVELQDEYAEPVQSLTGTIRVFRDRREDVVTMSLSQKLPYISYQEINPHKIIVDVFGATSNTNWKTKYLDSEGIEEVEWRQVENDRFRLIIKLNNSQNWGYSVGYGWGSQLEIRVKRPPVIADILNPLKGRTIAVDAGHGGSSQGALGAAGFYEKEVTLMIAQKLQEALIARGANVIMTRTIDENVSMSERKEIIANSNADLLVSIHANSIGYLSDPVEIRGSGVFYKHIAYKPLAEVMYKKMLELGLKPYGLTGSFNFSLNGPIEYPNVLIETAFISNPEEEILLSDEEFQRQIARQLVNGLEEYYLENAEFRGVGNLEGMSVPEEVNDQ